LNVVEILRRASSAVRRRVFVVFSLLGFFAAVLGWLGGFSRSDRLGRDRFQPRFCRFCSSKR